MIPRTASDGTTPMPADGGRGGLLRVMVETLPSCGCGQALDTSPGRRCPRCGVAVKSRDTSTPGGVLAVA